MRYILSILLVFVVLTSSAGYKNIEELKILNKMIQNKSQFDKKKNKTITLLKQALAETKADTARIDIYNKIGDEYTLYMADSAIFYYNYAADLCVNIGDSVRAVQTRIKRIRPETIAGFYAEAQEEFAKISTNNLSDSILSNYYECGYRLYSMALKSTERGNPYYDKYNSKATEFRDLWLNSQPEGSLKRELYEAEQYFVLGKYNGAKMILRELLSTLDEKSNEYAISAAIMASIMRAEGNIEEALRFYALSATADIECSVKENQSIYDISLLLYELGDIDSAYRYILASIEDAAFCSAQVRVYNASRMLPVIEDAHQKEQKTHERVLFGYGLIVSLLVVGLVAIVILLFRQMKKLSTARRKLHDANTTKDEYMGQFLELCSVYMRRLDSFMKLVNRKLTSGQVEDLLKTIKSARFSDQQHQEFYNAFDIAFLKVYDTFVDDFNALLRPEERYNIETPGTLNKEMRIYALIRLGISDNTKIAEFLKYSVNTIYTYRNKIKNKAINRAEFENNVRNIGIVE